MNYYTGVLAVGTAIARPIRIAMSRPLGPTAVPSVPRVTPARRDPSALGENVAKRANAEKKANKASKVRKATPAKRRSPPSRRIPH